MCNLVNDNTSMAANTNPGASMSVMHMDANTNIILMPTRDYTNTKNADSDRLRINQAHEDCDKIKSMTISKPIPKMASSYDK